MKICLNRQKFIKLYKSLYDSVKVHMDLERTIRIHKDLLRSIRVSLHLSGSIRVYHRLSGLEVSGFRSQGTGTHLTIHFCAFLHTLECLDIFLLSFWGKSLCVPGFLGTGIRTEFRVPKNEEPVPNRWE